MPFDNYFGANITKNKNGVEGIMSSSGSQFGREVVDYDGVKRFRTNLPVFVPKCCLDCAFYDPGEFGEYGSQLSGPSCNKYIYFPTKKGTCKAKR